MKIERLDWTLAALENIGLRERAEPVIELLWKFSSPFIADGFFCAFEYNGEPARRILRKKAEDWRNLVKQFDRKASFTQEELARRRAGIPIETDRRKLVQFLEIFHALASDYSDVKKETLVQELVNSGQFTEGESHMYIKKAQESGEIFERKVGVYAVAI